MLVVSGQFKTYMQVGTVKENYSPHFHPGVVHAPVRTKDESYDDMIICKNFGMDRGNVSLAEVLCF